MTALAVILPNSVHQKTRELAVRDDISVNQFYSQRSVEEDGIRADPRFFKARSGPKG
jgi:hypothetical protein